LKYCTKPNLDLSMGAWETSTGCVPLAKTCVQVDDRLAPVNLAEARSKSKELLVSGLGEEASDVDIGDALAVFKTLGKSHFRRIGPHCGHSSGNCRILLRQHLQILHDVASGSLHHLKGQAGLTQVRRDTGRIPRERRAVHVGGSGVVVVVRLATSVHRRRSRWFLLVVGTPGVFLHVRHVVVHDIRPREPLHGTRDHGAARVHVGVDVGREVRHLALVRSGSGNRSRTELAHLGKAAEHGPVWEKEEAIVGRTSSRQVKVGSHAHVALHGTVVLSRTLVLEVEATKEIGNTRSFGVTTRHSWSLRESAREGSTGVVMELSRLVHRSLTSVRGRMLLRLSLHG
jgi:hypothetical protein